MKKLSLILAAAMLSASLVGCGGAKSSETLNLYTWEGMFPEEVISDFENETGIRVNYVNFDYNETMLMKLETENGGGYDLVIADDYIIETAIKEGLVAKLDRSKLTNIDNVNPLFTGQFYDPTNEYTVPYGSGVQTIVYNPANVSVDISGYADLWDPSLADSVGIIANYRVIDGMALKILGKSYNTTNIDDIKAAGEKLNELAPNIRLIKDDYIQDDLLSGEISAAVMYTSQVTMAKLADPTLRVVYPSEGLGFGIMGMFIPSGAPNSDAAHRFIDYILDAETGAKCFEYLGYYCTNKASEQFISEEYRDFLTLPESFDSSDMEMIENITPEADDAHIEVWSGFKALCD